ncbi:hypothetical protein T459_02333 [Capsicum annuum]|uniref:THIF-type NAD/FAD binding fold domain-containing protein n=1 Tax=Capsicum annuum TaxID=4072 RepID=A0A2G3AJM4_CAPAN|nr:hypothetical protein T459_02333 [Capsicum annuum]
MTVRISLARDLKVAYSWINSSTQIVEHKEAFRTSNALDIVSKYDMVVDATDNAPSHYMINDCCSVLGKQKSKFVVCGNPVKLSLRQYASKAVGRRHFFSNTVVWKGDAYAAADLIVSRARAMICSKILSIGKPCILVMDIVDCLFVAMFDSLNDTCKKKLEAIGRQYPFEPLKAVRPFYTMPCHENPSYNNSFDVFIGDSWNTCHKEPPLMPRHKKEMPKRVIPTWQYKGPIIDQTKGDERFEEKEPEPLEQAIMKGENIIPTLETAATNSSQPA